MSTGNKQTTHLYPNAPNLLLTLLLSLKQYFLTGTVVLCQQVTNKQPTHLYPNAPNLLLTLLISLHQYFLTCTDTVVWCGVMLSQQPEDASSTHNGRPQKGFSLVVVEGGPKGVKKFIRLMLKRVDWETKVEAYATPYSASAGQDEGDNTSCQHTFSTLLSTFILNAPSQHINSTHQLISPSQPTFSTHPLNTPSQHIHPTHPLNPPSQHTLSTHLLNPSDEEEDDDDDDDDDDEDDDEDAAAKAPSSSRSSSSRAAGAGTTHTPSSYQHTPRQAINTHPVKLS